MIFSEQVNCISLDYFIQNTNIIPTFLKIDVEGSEEELIIGAEKLLQKYKPILSMGLYHENNNNNITFLIKNYNFLYNLYFFLEKNG
ncbi:MAG: FkbM family methyltransferase [Firmicutes bacterium]|nr:FkbM family methyltransferase [Bacillota bacterium]